MKSFEKMHPLPILVYMLCVMLATMLTLNPIVFAISFVGGWLFCLSIAGIKAAMSSLIFYLPTLIFIAALNPLFAREGVTILFNIGQTAVTLEALLYGVAVGAMLVTMLLWFANLNKIMDSGKSLWLFGKIIPKLTVVISMALRFTPLFIKRLKSAHATQKTLGMFASNNYFVKIKSHLQVFYSVFASAIEGAVDTADSMKARGYGNKHRHDFSLTRFKVFDGMFLIFSVACFAAIVALACFNGFAFSFYPYMDKLFASNITIATYAVCSVMFFAPSVVAIGEEIRWKLMIKKI